MMVYPEKGIENKMRELISEIKKRKGEECPIYWGIKNGLISLVIPEELADWGEMLLRKHLKGHFIILNNERVDTSCPLP